MDMLINLLIAWLQEYPLFGSIIMILGVTRALVKPMMSLINAFVQATPWPQDNAWWAKIGASDVMKTFLYFLDWTTSIKIKPK